MCQMPGYKIGRQIGAHGSSRGRGVGSRVLPQIQSKERPAVCGSARRSSNTGKGDKHMQNETVAVMFKDHKK